MEFALARQEQQQEQQQQQAALAKAAQLQQLLAGQLDSERQRVFQLQQYEGQYKESRMRADHLSMEVNDLQVRYLYEGETRMHTCTDVHYNEKLHMRMLLLGMHGNAYMHRCALQ